MRLCPASRSRLLTLLLAAAWRTSEAQAASAETPKLLDRIDAFAQAERERQKIPGLALAVVKDGRMLKAAGYGLANLEHQVPVKTETVFQSGSVGKQFTATALMLLAEDGTVRLDDSADGSLYLTVLDLAAWDQGLRSRAILKPESWGQVFAPVTLTSGKRYPYGFGWAVEEVAGGMVHRHGGSWQGFQAYIARYVNAGLTIIVLANLADADTEPIVEGIAGLVDPKLAKPALRPIPDREPAATARLRDVLVQAGRGDLTPAAFAYVPTGLSGALKEYEKLLRPLGSPTRLDLLERRELGDDRVYLYEAVYGAKVLRVRLGLAPDGRVALFEARPK